VVHYFNHAGTRLTVLEWKKTPPHQNKLAPLRSHRIRGLNFFQIGKQEVGFAGGFKELTVNKFLEPKLAFYTNEARFTLNGNVNFQEKRSVILKLPSQSTRFFT